MFPRGSVEIGLVFVYLVVLVRTAWLSDDAYITFRYAYNVVHGYGLTWNPGYRVQAFTNPLWMLFVSAAYFVTREIYYTSLVLSMLFSVGTLGIVWKIATSRARFWLGASILILSKAYVDFSTSGLEDPLLHFLLAGFAFVFLAEPRVHKRLLYLSLGGALLMTTRMDTVLLFAPAVVLAAIDGLDRSRLAESSYRAARTMAIGGLPFFVWKGFAMMYYGYPVPNTYFAKTTTTDTSFELVRQAYHYFAYSFAQDFVLLAGLAVGSAFAFVRGDRRLKALALGIALYLAYLVAIGGDFMAGRLLTEPLLISVIILVRSVGFSPERAKAGLLLLVVVSIGFPTAPPLFQTLQADADYGGASVNEHGIIDERGFYYQGTGLIADKDRKNTHLWAAEGRRWGDASQRVFVAGVIGMRGYYAGPDVHIIDYNALADPLLSHLVGEGRVGHYARRLPAGYVTTIETGENHIKSEGVHRFYDKVVLVTTGDVWSADRISAIVRMNLGAYDYLLSSQIRWTYPLDRIDRPLPNGTAWNAPQVIVFEHDITATAGGAVHHPVVEISTDHNDRYRLEFVNGGTVVGSTTLPPTTAVEEGLVTRRVAVPPSATRTGFTRIHIIASQGDGKYSVGHVRLMNETATTDVSFSPVFGGER